MSKVKDFNYYGKKRWKVQRLLRFFNKQDYNCLFLLVPLFFMAFTMDLEKNLNFDLSNTGGIVTLIFLMFFIYYSFSFITLIILRILDKYYFEKRKVKFEEYLQSKNCTCTRKLHNSNT